MAYRREPNPVRKLKAAPQAEPSSPLRAAPWAPPAEALPVWLGPDGDLMIGLPPRAGEAGHSVRITSRKPEVMAKVLLRILSDRAAVPFARVAEPGVPTQALAEALSSAMASGQKITYAELRAERLDDADFL